MLLKLLELCTSHSSRKISALTFEFWCSFVKNLKLDPDLITGPNSLYFIQPYLNLFQIVLEKCKLRSMKHGKQLVLIPMRKKKKVFNVETNEEEEDDGEGLLDLDGEKMDIGEYRSLSDDIFFSVMDVLKGSGQAGEELYFRLILERLEQAFYEKNYSNLTDPVELRNEFILTVEVSLYAVINILDHYILDRSNQFLKLLISKIINELPRDEIIVKTSLQLLYDASNELKFSQELAPGTFAYILSFINHPIIGDTASQVSNTIKL